MSKKKGREQRFPLDRPPDGMVVEPALPQFQENMSQEKKDKRTSSQVSVDNSLAEADNETLPEVRDAQGNPVPLNQLTGPAEATADEAPEEVRRATANVQPTGVHFNFAPFHQIVALHQAGQTNEARAAYDALNPQARYVYDNIRNMERVPAAEAARLADEFRKMQDEQMRSANPAKEAADKAAAATSQLELQEAYRQEAEYQRSLATINNPDASRAEWNAARMQMDGLAASIGKRINPKGGTSQTAMKETKNAVGYIGALESKNPLADFTPRLNTMLRGSQERMALIRQQMEAAGVSAPEMTAAPAATQEDMRAKTSDMVMSMAGVKDQSGGVVMIGGSPVIKVPEAGKPVYKKRGPGGGWINLTQEEAASLGAQ